MTARTRKHEDAMSDPKSDALSPSTSHPPSRTTAGPASADPGSADGPAPHGGPAAGRAAAAGRAGGGLFEPARLFAALPEAFRKLDPRVMVKSPVMFVVWAARC